MNMFLLIGLGNPGATYATSRHNVGFQVVEKLINRYDHSLSPIQFKYEKKWQTELASIHIAKQTVLVLKPQTYMNRSGIAVGAVAGFYRIPLERIIVVHDEIDLPLGVLRLSFRSSSAGHNGVQSIIATLGSTDFYRLRIGIAPIEPHAGSTTHPLKAKAFVLETFSQEETLALGPVIDKAIHAVEMLITQGYSKTASIINRK